MEEQIYNWYRTNNNHACDNSRFFDIVIASENAVIDRACFERALRRVDESVSDDTIDDVYRKYQDLREFLLYVHRDV